LSVQGKNQELDIVEQGHSRLGATNIDNPFIVKMLLVFWFLRLFKPEWILAYYFPALSFLKPLPTIFVIFFCACLVFSNKKVQFDRSMLFFVMAVSFSTLFSQNRGLSFGSLRGVGETFIVSSMFLTFLTDKERIKKLFAVYAISFVFFGVWGIKGGGLVKAFMPLADEDSFGPFMAVGFSLTYFIHYAQEKRRNARFYLGVSGLSLIGAVASFARGTFVSLILAAVSIFTISSNKFRLIAKSLVVGFLALCLAWIALPDWMGRYSREVGTIWEQGSTEGTARNRLYLWSIAWDMFVDHPLLGVGPQCYGYRISVYETPENRAKWNEDRQLYGRATHNIYFQILSEMGSLGILAFVILIHSFAKKNFQTTRFFSTWGGRNVQYRSALEQEATHGGWQYYAMGLLVGMIVFLINGFFFNLLYFSWFWDLLILNSLIYHKVLEKQTAC
jgi:O-antigen ligase